MNIHKKHLSRIIKAHKKKPSKEKLFRLLKASLLILIAPLMVLSIFTIYGKLSFMDAFYGVAAAFAISILFIRPYLADLSALTEYVEQLSIR